MKTNLKNQYGVALLEVLIAFFVLSIGLLGLAGLQVKTMQFNQSAHQRSQAMFAAYDMMDRMRLDREQMLDGTFNTGDWTNSATGANDDLDDWIKTITTSFPNGQAKVDCDSNNVCTIGVRWTDRFTAQEEGAEAAYEEISLVGEM